MELDKLRTIIAVSYTHLDVYKRQIDAFDEYVEQWNALGGSDIIAELEALKQ